MPDNGQQDPVQTAEPQEAEFTRVLSDYAAIQSALGRQEQDPDGGIASFELPLGTVLDLLPPRHRLYDPHAAPPRDKSVTILVDDLFAQLARGRVAVPIAKLLFAVPPEFVNPLALKDQTLLDLPLPLVVTAVDPKAIRQRVAAKSRTYRIERFPDLFTVAAGCQLRSLPQRPRSLPTLASHETVPLQAVVPLPNSTADTSPSSVSLSPTEIERQASLSGPRLGLRAAGRLPKPLDPDAQHLSAADPRPEAAVPPVPRRPASAPPEAASSVASVLRDYRHIQSALCENPTLPPPAPIISLSVFEILKLLPDAMRASPPVSDGTGSRKITLVVDNLFEQLAKGRVAIPVAQMVMEVPRDLIAPEALLDQTPVALPLPLIVRAVDPRLLAARIPGKPRTYAMQGLPDFFTVSQAPAAVPEPALDLPAEAPAPAAMPEPEPERLGQPPAGPEFEPPAEPATEPLPETAAAEDFGDVDRLAGVNLNTATAEQLAALKGVSRAVARRIVEHRAEHGPFRDVFDLMQIPRIGRKTFKAITGMPCSRRHRHRRERMATLLALPPDRASHLPSIAQALAGQPGFAGCIISDDEGFRIASRGAEPYAEALSAVLPKLTRQVRDSMKECTPEEIRSLSIQIGRHMATIVPGQDVFLTAVHDASRLTMGQLRLVTRVARELAWLLGRRGYVTVGIPPAGAEREPADAPPVSASPSAEETTP